MTAKKYAQAVHYGINKEEVLKAADLGKGRLMDSVLGELVYGYHKVGSYDYDPQKAKDLELRQVILTGSNRRFGHRRLARIAPWRCRHSCRRLVSRLRSQMESAALNQLAKPVDQSSTEMVVSNWSPSTGDADWGLRPLYTKAQWPPAEPPTPSIPILMLKNTSRKGWNTLTRHSVRRRTPTHSRQFGTTPRTYSSTLLRISRQMLRVFPES